MRVNLLFGPAKSGKTTFLQKKKLEGCCIISGGDYAYEMAEYTGRHDIAQAREDKDDMELPEYNRIAARGTIINYIENKLIRRTYGTREKFIRKFVSAQLNPYTEEVWYEAFSNAECEHVLSAIIGPIDVKVWEMHREGISYGADGREPSRIPGTIKIFAECGKFVDVEGVTL